MFEQTLAEMDDPMTIESWEVDGLDAFGLVTLDGDIRNLRVGGHHNIVLQSIHMNINTLALDVDVIVPGMTFDATHYDLAGRFGGIIPIFGKGGFQLSSRDVRVRGTATLAVDENLYVSLKSFKSTMTMGGLTANFENLLMGGELGDLMNYIIGDMVPFVVRNQQAEVTALLEQLVLEVVNESLEGVLLEELLERIMEFQ